MGIELSKDQEQALEAMLNWYNNRNPSNKQQQVFYLAGWAGTGKTTLANIFTKSLPSEHKILYASFTGKAALRMRQAGMRGAQTLHSLIYHVETGKGGKPIFTLNQKSELRKANLLILDECSMVGKELGEDVLSFGTPILILGDQGQLPPVKGTGFFTGRKPNATLSEVHRQALENPIIQFATDIRLGKPIKKYCDEHLIVYANKELVDEHITQVDQILVGSNKTRRVINARMREEFNHLGPYPEAGERVICLRNNRREKIFNGMIGTLETDAYFEKEIMYLDFVDEEGNLYQVNAHPEGFQDDDLLGNMDWEYKKLYNEFTYGYAITVHKAQGSQWDSVMILDDGFLIWDKPNRKRWLYTAVTRAAEKLIYAKRSKR